MRKPSIFFISVLLILSFIFSNFHSYENASANLNYDLVVSADSLHLREGPGLSYSILKTLKKNEQLQFIEREREWYFVRVGEQSGWVASWLTSPIDENRQNIQQTAISQVDQLNVYSEASLSSSVLSQLYSGQQVDVVETKDLWVKIIHNDTIGWVSNDYVTVNEVDAKKETNEKGKSTSTKKSVQDENTFTITVDEVIIRKKADLTSRPLGSVKKGEQYEVLERHNNWVKIKYNKKSGWLYNFYGTFNPSIQPIKQDKKESNKHSDDAVEFITTIYNSTNIREEPTPDANIIFRADAGKTYKIVDVVNDWYKIQINQQTTGYVANWVVSNSTENVATQQPKQNRKKGTLNGVTIVVDPGHGGNDRGTTGARGTDEKDITLKTAQLLISKLKRAGATVISTRESDTYVDLRKRVSISHQYTADAFISLHYDATEDNSISGVTTYYAKDFQKSLGDYVHKELANKVDLRDRGVQPSNFLVLRENKRNAILIELGFLSNPSEERTVTTDFYREQATLGIYEGLINYFDHLIEKEKDEEVTVDDDEHEETTLP